ncbi:MAG TPA: hypothetical protein PLS66_00775 [Tepiditoga sp.]|nr:hypothetical protein [Tepiditoga sp.]
MLKDGYTYMHEHMRLDLSGVKKDQDCNLDCYDETLEEIKELFSMGIKNIVEVTNIGMERDISYINRLGEKSGMNFIVSTGFYKEPFLPEYVYEKNEKELAQIMISEIEKGIDNTGVKAGIIGEIGTSNNEIKDSELKIFKAASIAHLETGKPITTHTTLGTMGKEQIKIFREYGVDLNKVIIGHTDLTGDEGYIEDLINKGVYVEIDTIGKIKYLSDEKRLDIVNKLCSKGYSERMVLSMDITRKSHMKKFGGIGYTYLMNYFIPELLKMNVKNNDIENMLRYNPLKIFGE